MDCNVGIISSEIKIPKHLHEINEDFYDSVKTSDLPATSYNMGIENTWGTDDFTATPLTDLAIPLPPPDPSALLKYDANTINNSTIGDDIDRLISPVNRNNDEDILGQNNEAGVCGLRNLGNTCFMSAGVQCLLATAPLVSSLLITSGTVLSQSTTTQRISLTNSIGDLIRKVWSGKYTSLHPTKFRYSISTQFPQFGDYRQHDCQEFLALLLDGLHEQLNLAKKKGNSLADSSTDTPSCSLKSIENTPFIDEQDLDDECEEYIPEGRTFNNYVYIPTKINESNIINDLLCDNNAPKKSNILLNANKINKATVAIELNNSDKCSSKINNSTVCDNIIHNIDCNATPDIPLNNLEDIVDIVKNAKTSNVNVMVAEEEANNEIRFDSEKYPRTDLLRRKAESCTVNNSFHLYENNIIGKRGKSTMKKFMSGTNLKEGLDLKRVKLNSPTDEPEEKNKRMESERQQKLSDDKNKRMESERKESINEYKESEPSGSGLNTNEIRFDCTSEPDADLHWQQHLAENRSVIVDTFQGQFKSTVICSNCKFVSVTYEPFMYLSVPLPNTMKKKFCVTFVNDGLKEPTQYYLEVNKYDNVGTLKKQLVEKIDTLTRGWVIVIAEVLNHHIAKLLDDNCIIRNINDSDRNIYAFKIINIAEPTNCSALKTEGDKGEEYLVDNRCTICLEDKHCNMKQHMGCSCVLCETCITAACQHSRDTFFKCPLCRKDVNPETEMTNVVSERQFTVRSINVPIVFRMDTVSENNNEKEVKLFGHPMLLRLPNRITAEFLQDALKKIIPYDSSSYKLLTVDGQGSHCSRCMFNTHCRGCDILSEGQINLYSGDTLAVAFSSAPPSPARKPSPSSLDISTNDSQNTSIESTTTCLSSSSRLRHTSTLSLYDCISAFSQSERLDESNPWYCPKCLEHRCATKTLTVWRYPDYLIVYLKRFVFHNRIITKLDEKVEFPLVGLTFDTESVYDLYGVVCHVGGVTAGHYTAYTKHPFTGVWHYFNDCYVTRKTPQEDDLRNAYILFYKKQGINVPSFEVDVKSSISELI